MARRSLRKATVVGWSGRGRIENLESSVMAILEAGGLTADVKSSGGSVTVRGSEPAAVGSALRNTPGISWLAVGMATDNLEEVGESARLLGRRYLKTNSRFSVAAVGGEGVSASDISGRVVSAVLDEVKGSRVDEERPQVVFRASLSSAGGGIGIEISEGPGGVPTGTQKATVLLSGYRLRMVHAKVDDESLLAVARLYAELSHRVDPLALSLDVLFGDDPGSLVYWAVRKADPPVFAGFHSGCSEGTGIADEGTISPLYLAHEEWLASEGPRLLSNPYVFRQRWGRRATAPAKVRSVGGIRGDVSSVLDALVSGHRKER